MVENPLLVKLSTWLASLLPAIFGAAISLRVSSFNSTFSQRFFTFAGGVGLAVWLGGGTIDYFHVNRETMIDESIIVAWAIFGMSAVTEIWTQFPHLIKGLREAIVSWVGRKP